ncbi:hypothetical protein DV733_05050 [Halapricum salinum]|uniref:DUF7509 domain-containing protein n=2 Tax=Halapricum salinum TaxID=1457250 RepID=A0A4D6HFZ0_9EURY|nr:hypothetical protein DV733_05050 [Halapricum salinum]
MEQMRYRGESVGDIIERSISAPESAPLLFLMGPYRLLDPKYVYAEGEFPLPTDPLAPSNEVPQPDLIETTLREIASRISEATAATAFIASDVDIPTRKEVADKGLDEPGMAVIDQSVAFARASAGNAFVFTKAGLTTGVGAETGAIPEHFRLRKPGESLRDPRMFCIFAEGERRDNGTYDPRFSSASIDEMDDAYDLRFMYFETREELVEKLVTFVEAYVIPLHGDDQL